MQPFGNLAILSFFVISWFSWVGHVNRLDSKRKVTRVFNVNCQGS